MTSRALVRIVATALVFTAPAATAAQDAGPLCLAKSCSLVLDWGPGKTSASYSTDLRYGAAEDFESAVRRALTSHAVRLSDSAPALVITLRTRIDSRALCDRMEGTSSRHSCVAMQDVAVAFASRDSAVKAPSGVRITNRCGDNVYATMSQFGEYVGELVWMSLAGPNGKGKKPPLKC